VLEVGFFLLSISLIYTIVLMLSEKRSVMTETQQQMHVINKVCIFLNDKLEPQC